MSPLIYRHWPCWLGLTAVLMAGAFGAQVQAEVGSARLNGSASDAILVKVEAIADGAGSRARASIEIARSPAEVWAVMIDCNRALKFVGRLKSCKITAADSAGRWDVREHVVNWLWPLSSVRSVFRSDYEPFAAIHFRKIDGDLKSLAGTWRLQPIRDGRATRLSYDARIDPGVPLPDFLVQGAIESELRDTLAGLRREVTGGG